MNLKRPWVVAAATVALAGFGGLALATDGSPLNDPQQAPVVQLDEERAPAPADGSPESADSPAESPVDSADSADPADPADSVDEPDPADSADSPN